MSYTMDSKSVECILGATRGDQPNSPLESALRGNAELLQTCYGAAYTGAFLAGQLATIAGRMFNQLSPAAQQEILAAVHIP